MANPWIRLGEFYTAHEASFKATTYIVTVLSMLGGVGTWAWKTLRDERPDVQIQLVNPTRPVVVLENVSSATATQIKYAFALVKIIGPEIGQLLQVPIGMFDFINGHTKGGPQTIFDFPGIAPADGQKFFGWILVTCPTCARVRYYYAYINFGHDGWYTEVSPQRHEAIAKQLKDNGPYSGDETDKVQSVVAPTDRIKIGLP